MSQALYRKWRPARFDAVIGQEHVTRTLRNAIASGRSGHAYLFCGPRGTGKTTTARLLAKAVNCLHEELAERPCNECANCRAIAEGRFLDLIEIDAASNTGVDDIRDLRDKINFAPSEGRFKVYIIDEVHMLSTAAFNALLKTLEEPPPHAKFVLATTEEHKVPLTIKSRCQQFNFRLLTVAEITGRLRWIAEQEHLSIDPQALALIARQGSGSIRDAESLLDQLVAAPGDEISLERTQMVLGTASNQAISALVDAWLAADAAQGLRVIHEALASGADVRQFARQTVDYLRQVLLLQAAGDDAPLDLPDEERSRMVEQSRLASREGLIDAVKAFNNAALASSSSWQPQLPLELGFISLLPAEAAGAARQRAPSEGRAPGRPAQATARTRVAEPAPELQAEKEAVPEPVQSAGESPRSEALPDDDVETAAREAPHPTPAPSPPDAITLDAVQRRWERMVERVGQQDRNLPALLAVSKPLAVEGNAIILGFDYGVLKDKFEDRGEARELVASTMSDLLDHKCTVRCVVTAKYTPPPPPQGGSEEAAAQQSQASQKPAVDRDAFYALAKELGGEVRES
ncbi:MAG TPA: DNA polymerase III subunit gamma/tau [Candidatus Binatia bacterium]|nr:DNA polymerase III subunit gamma/tau [Candidatus Binatia bacterium]